MTTAQGNAGSLLGAMTPMAVRAPQLWQLRWAEVMFVRENLTQGAGNAVAVEVESLCCHLSSVGPKRLVRTRPGAWPKPTSRLATSSTKGAGAQT